MTKEYAAALAEHNAAQATFNAVTKAYRARQIGDDEYLAARAAYGRATKKFDEAFDREANRKPRISFKSAGAVRQR